MLCNLTKLFACMAATIEGKQSHHYGGEEGLQAFPLKQCSRHPQIEIGNIMNHRSLAKLALLHKVKPPY